MKKRIQLFFTLLLGVLMSFSATKVMAQCGPLATPTLTNNGQDGIMFDIQAIQSVNITQFAMDFDTGMHTIEIYGKAGTHVGFANNAAAWTLLGTTAGWNSTGGTNVLIPIVFSQFLCAGDVAGFYITSTTGGCNYSNGTAVGAVMVADANIQIKQGTGKDYSFAASFTPRKPNVITYYSCATSCCLPPTMSFVAESCSGACDGTATATVGAGGVGPYTYLWDAAAGSQTTQTATGLCAGTYNVDVTDATGCIATNSVTVTSGGVTSDATITPAGPYCDSDAAVWLTGADPGGTWSGTGITNAATGEFDPGVAGGGVHTITYTISGACGDSQTTDITVNASYDATITPAGPFCESDAAVWLSAVDPGGSWSGTGITNAATGEFDPVIATAGTHTITYTISGACGDVQTEDITVSAVFDATITPAGPYCDSDASVTLSAADPGGTWSGTGITDAVTGEFDPATASSGTHTITYTIPGGCGNASTTDIIVNPPDDATITPAGPFCLGSPVYTLTGAAGSGNWSGTGITNASAGEFDASVAGTGIHTITYTTGGPCTSMSTIDIEVLDVLVVQAFQDNTICSGESANLTATGSGGDGNLTYTWMDQLGNSVGSGNSLTVSPMTTTTYTVTLTDGCSTPSTSSSVTITVNPTPVVSFTADNVSGCDPVDVTFTNTSTPAGTDGLWNLGNGVITGGLGSVSTQYNQTGCYDVTLTITANGCTSSQTMQDLVCVSEYPDAQFNFSPGQPDILNPEVQFDNQSNYATQYAWSFGDASAASGETDPLHTFDAVAETYEVCLIASNDEYCADTVCINVTIEDLLIYYIPNSFSPDGNSFNQLFKPVFTTGFDPFDFNFLIFNRWGQIIWESNDPELGWDGVGPNGKLVESGTYVWRVEFKSIKNDERLVETGHVNLLR